MNLNPKLRAVACVALLTALTMDPSLHAAPATVTRTSYNGWNEAYVLGNGEVEAVIVPAVGRVMQFRFLGEEGVFWENSALQGKVVSTNLTEWRTNDWQNFGGEKAWPSPEGSWTQWTGRVSWRPPLAFDGLGHQARQEGSAVVLTSPEDALLGVVVTRRIELSDPTTLRIQTTFEKKAGTPLKTGVWTVVQLNEPERLFAPVPKKSIFVRGYVLLSQRLPPSLKVEDGFVTLTRDTKGSYKIGLDALDLLWVGPKHCLRVEHERPPGEYPDRGSSTEIYTNPDPLRYIELETLGPVKELKPKDRVEQTVKYHLTRRSQPTPEGEAKLLKK